MSQQTCKGKCGSRVLALVHNNMNDRMSSLIFWIMPIIFRLMDIICIKMLPNLKFGLQLQEKRIETNNIILEI